MKIYVPACVSLFVVEHFAKMYLYKRLSGHIEATIIEMSVTLERSERMAILFDHLWSYRRIRDKSRTEMSIIHASGMLNNVRS